MRCVSRKADRVHMHRSCTLRQRGRKSLRVFTNTVAGGRRAAGFTGPSEERGRMLVIKQRGASRTPDKCASALGPLVKRSAGTPRTPVLPAWLETVARIFAVLGAGVCLYAMRQADPDLWGYLAYGRLFV